MPKVTGAPEAVQTSWSPPSLSLGSVPGPLPGGELILRIPMESSFLHCPGLRGCEQLRKSGLGILIGPETMGSGLPSAQLSTTGSPNLALQGPSSPPSPPRSGTLAARWHCDPAERRPPAESSVWRGTLPSPSEKPDSQCRQRHHPGLPTGLRGLPYCPEHPHARQLLQPQKSGTMMKV